MEVILASGSIYRKKLLERLGLRFSAIPTCVDEEKTKREGHSPIEIAKKLAFLKADFLSATGKIVIGSDQVCECEGEVLDKPGNFENALKQLSKMSGKSHRLHTAVCLVIDKEKVVEFINTTTLKMRDLSEDQILKYLKFDQPFDCAGSYKIESRGISLFDKIDCTDFTSIEGLPLMELSYHLRQSGIKSI